MANYQPQDETVATPWGRLRATDPRVWGGFDDAPPISVEQMAEIGNAVPLGRLSVHIEGNAVTIESILPGPPPEYGTRRNA